MTIYKRVRLLGHPVHIYLVHLKRHTLMFFYYLNNYQTYMLDIVYNTVLSHLCRSTSNVITKYLKNDKKLQFKSLYVNVCKRPKMTCDHRMHSQGHDINTAQAKKETLENVLSCSKKNINEGY